MLRKVSTTKIDLLRATEQPEEGDVELDLVEVASQAFERIRAWYGEDGLARCLRFTYDRFKVGDDGPKSDAL